MFVKSKANGNGERISRGKGMPSIISADFRIVGDVTSDGDVQLDGAIEGNLTARSLTIGETGSVRGAVKVEQVHVHGTVVGPLRARTVEIAKTAKVTGDVLYDSLTVETGAVIDGACKSQVTGKTEVPQPVEAKVEKFGSLESKPVPSPLGRVASAP